jgi:hypothetical protein
MQHNAFDVLRNRKEVTRIDIPPILFFKHLVPRFSIGVYSFACLRMSGAFFYATKKALPGGEATWKGRVKKQNKTCHRIFLIDGY